MKEAFKNPFAMIASLSDSLPFGTRPSFWYKAISMNYGSSTSSRKSWRSLRIDLMLSMGNIYINSNLNTLIKFTSSSRKTGFKDILSWKISQMFTKIAPISTRIIARNPVKWDILLWIWWKINGNWKNSMIRIFQLGESNCRTNTIIRRNK